jgi:hypothetical protein
LVENDFANPRNLANPDALAFEKRHDDFYKALQIKGPDAGSAARNAFKNLRSWAYGRVRRHEDWIMFCEDTGYDMSKESTLDLGVLEAAATMMKCIWQDLGLWDYSRPMVSVQS